MALSQRATQVAEAQNPVLAMLDKLWDPETNPDGFLSLGIAENSLMHNTLSKHLHKNITLPNHSFTYGDGSQRLKDALCKFLTRHLKPVVPLAPEHFIILNGCTTAIEHTAWAFTNPGESILLGRPYYTAFPDDATLRTGSKLAEVSFHGTDPFGENCVEKYEAKLKEVEANGGKVSALILCNPHNPLGRCYPRQVIIDIMKFCQKYQLHLISDEIYALSVFENNTDPSPAPTPFTSILSIDPTDIIDPGRLHVLWGMSKDFGANGIRLGVIISQHCRLLHEATQPVNLIASASSITEHITANILNDDAWVEEYIAENQRLLGKHYEHITSWATENGIEYAPGANAGFFLWLNLGKAYKKHHPNEEVDLDHSTMNALMESKIFLAAGFRFGGEEPGWFRIVFTHEMDYLKKGLERIIQAITGKGLAVPTLNGLSIS